MKQNKSHPVAWAMRAALFLFCLMVATLSLAAGLHARYTSKAVASDGARVAKFEIANSGDCIDAVITASLAPGGTTTKTLTVQNKSEVAVEYAITVKNVTNNLPLEFSIAGNTPAAGDYTFSDDLPPLSDVRDYTLSISWPEAAASTEYVGMVDKVSVSISAVQID